MTSRMNFSDALASNRSESDGLEDDHRGGPDPQQSEFVSHALKRAYADVVSEPLPDRLLSLLDQLDQIDGTDEGDRP